MQNLRRKTLWVLERPKKAWSLCTCGRIQTWWRTSNWEWRNWMREGPTCCLAMGRIRKLWNEHVCVTRRRRGDICFQYGEVYGWCRGGLAFKGLVLALYVAIAASSAAVSEGARGLAELHKAQTTSSDRAGEFILHRMAQSRVLSRTARRDESFVRGDATVMEGLRTVPCPHGDVKLCVCIHRNQNGWCGWSWNGWKKIGRVLASCRCRPCRHGHHALSRACVAAFEEAARRYVGFWSGNVWKRVWCLVFPAPGAIGKERP